VLNIIPNTADTCDTTCSSQCNVFLISGSTTKYSTCISQCGCDTSTANTQSQSSKKEVSRDTSVMAAVEVAVVTTQESSGVAQSRVFLLVLLGVLIVGGVILSRRLKKAAGGKIRREMKN
jgi:hypothetical protein